MVNVHATGVVDLVESQGSRCSVTPWKVTTTSNDLALVMPRESRMRRDNAMAMKNRSRTRTCGHAKGDLGMMGLRAE